MAKNAEQLATGCIDSGRKCPYGTFNGKGHGQVMVMVMENCKRQGSWGAKISLELLLDIKVLSGQYLPLRKRNLEFTLCDLQKRGYLDFDKKSAWLTEQGIEFVRKNFCDKKNETKRRQGKVRGKINR